MDIKLTIELVPQTSHYTNLRSILSPDQWDKIRKETYKKAGYRCEICGGRGCKWPVEAHEIWEYDDINHIQKLIDIKALCPDCHEVKHIGLASIKGRLKEATNHFIKINKTHMAFAEKYINDQFELYYKRSCFDWKLDISLLDTKERG
jgi:hypothetical protein